MTELNEFWQFSLFYSLLTKFAKTPSSMMGGALPLLLVAAATSMALATTTTTTTTMTTTTMTTTTTSGCANRLYVLPTGAVVDVPCVLFGNDTPSVAMWANLANGSSWNDALSWNTLRTPCASEVAVLPRLSPPTVATTVSSYGVEFSASATVRGVHLTRGSRLSFTRSTALSFQRSALVSSSCGQCLVVPCFFF